MRVARGGRGAEGAVEARRAEVGGEEGEGEAQGGGGEEEGLVPEGEGGGEAGGFGCCADAGAVEGGAEEGGSGEHGGRWKVEDGRIWLGVLRKSGWGEL